MKARNHVKYTYTSKVQVHLDLNADVERVNEVVRALPPCTSSRQIGEQDPPRPLCWVLKERAQSSSRLGRETSTTAFAKSSQFTIFRG